METDGPIRWFFLSTGFSCVPISLGFGPVPRQHSRGAVHGTGPRGGPRTGADAKHYASSSSAVWFLARCFSTQAHVLKFRCTCIHMLGHSTRGSTVSLSMYYMLEVTHSHVRSHAACSVSSRPGSVVLGSSKAEWTGRSCRDLYLDHVEICISFLQFSCCESSSSTKTKQSFVVSSSSTS